MSGPIRRGDLVMVTPGDTVARRWRLYRIGATHYLSGGAAARLCGTEDWSVELEAGTILLVVLAPHRNINLPGRPYLVRVFHEGQLLDVMHEDVECVNGAQHVDGAQGPPTAASMGPPSKMW